MTIDTFIDNIITKLAAMRNMTIVKQTKVVNDFNITNGLSLTSVLSDKLSTRIMLLTVGWISGLQKELNKFFVKMKKWNPITINMIS